MTRKKKSTKEPLKILVLKQKTRTVLLKAHQATENKTTTGRKRKQVDHLEGEFKKIKPSTFDGESRTGEEVEAWLLDIKKYFQIYNYSSNMKVRMAIYNLKGKSEYLVARPEIGQGIKRETDGMVRFQEILQETIFIRKLL
jgi:hypothetical protein